MKYERMVIYFIVNSSLYKFKFHWVNNVSARYLQSAGTLKTECRHVVFNLPAFCKQYIH